ncbi:MAG: hypothetical protein L0H31_13990 [Nocardioidaceae bacterium]|nr:hypothetical protein [Nocardioidaceae bacterium]
MAYFLDPERPEVRKRHVAMAQAAAQPKVREEMIRHTAEVYIAPLAPRLSGEHRELRVALAVAQIGGLLTLLLQHEDPVLAAADTDDLIALYGDAIQRMLTP